MTAVLLHAARSMAQGYGWEFTCIFDKNQDLKRAMNVSLTPQTFIIDAEGNVDLMHIQAILPAVNWNY